MLDVKGGFLQGEFLDNEHGICMKIPDGLEKKHPDNVLMKLLAPTHSLKNDASFLDQIGQSI